MAQSLLQQQASSGFGGEAFGSLGTRLELLIGLRVQGLDPKTLIPKSFPPNPKTP